LPSFLVKSRGFSITQMTIVATIGYAVQAVCALAYGRFSDWWTVSGRSEAACRRWMMVASQGAATIAILGLSIAHSSLAIGLLLCLAGAASGSLSLNLYAVGQMFSGSRAAGTWMGFQNAIGNASGIFGPILTGFIVQRAGYDSAFLVTAAIAAAGALMWIVAVPKIEPIDIG
ncbi:MAG TPA: MFS transporter, partial [Sphingomicrobium sp.]|nr:MFS transporter [Sphingomicrobium sp.]